MAKPKDGRGGARPGAGRKLGGKNFAQPAWSTKIYGNNPLLDATLDKIQNRIGDVRLWGFRRRPKVRCAFRLPAHIKDTLAAVAATGRMSQSVAIEVAVRHTFGTVAAGRRCTNCDEELPDENRKPVLDIDGDLVVACPACGYTEIMPVRVKPAASEIKE